MGFAFVDVVTSLIVGKSPYLIRHLMAQAFCIHGQHGRLLKAQKCNVQLAA